MCRKTVTIILILILSFNLTACSNDGNSGSIKRYEAQFSMLFDTITLIIGYTKGKDEFTEFAELIYDKLEEYHQLYDIYNDYEGINNIKTINDNAGIAPVKVDKKIIDLLVFAKEAYEKTDGMINIAFGSVLEIWHEYRTKAIEDPEEAELPPVDLLKAASEHTDIKNMIIDEAESTVYLKDPEMSLDVGAIAKGYSVERVAEYAMENGFDSGVISVGGNVRTIGYKGVDNKLWNIGVQNPEKGQPDLMIVNLTDLSLVTSGTYQRYYTYEGRIYHHIINRDTLFPAEYYDAVTIICKDSGTADALSTAVFNMTFEQGKAFIESIPDTEALWVFPNGDIEYSSNFEDLIK